MSAKDAAEMPPFSRAADYAPRDDALSAAMSADNSYEAADERDEMRRRHYAADARCRRCR